MKLEDLINEFNGLYTRITCEGEQHFGDKFVCLDRKALSSSELIEMLPFIKKYNGKLGIHPEKYNDRLVIRISNY